MFEVVEHGCAELVQPALGQLRLRLDAHGPGEACPLRAVGDVAEQRALADAGLPAQHQDPAATGGRIRQELVEDLTLGLAPAESHRPHPSTARRRAATVAPWRRALPAHA